MNQKRETADEYLDRLLATPADELTETENLNLEIVLAWLQADQATKDEVLAMLREATKQRVSQVAV